MPKLKDLTKLKDGSRAQIKAIREGRLPVPVGKYLTKSTLRTIKGYEVLQTKADEPPKPIRQKTFTVRILDNLKGSKARHVIYDIKEGYAKFSVPFIKETETLLKKVLLIQSRKQQTNKYLNIKLFYRIPSGGAFSVIFDKAEVNINHMIKVLKYKMSNSVYGDSGEDAELVSIEVKTFNLSTAGGCVSRTKIITNKFSDAKLISPKSSNNNCAFMCFIARLGLDGLRHKPNNIRAKLSIPLHTLIHINQLDHICDYFNSLYSDRTVSYVLWNELKQVIGKKDNSIEGKENVLVEMYLENDHFYYVERFEKVGKVQCKVCFRWLLETNTTHPCNPKQVKYNNQQTNLKKVKIVEPRYFKRRTKLNYDTEVIYNINEVEGLETFKHLIVYNDSGIKLNKLLKDLIKRNIRVYDFIQKDNNILTFSTDTFKVVDLNLFLDMPFDKACEDFGCNTLKELFIKFNDIIFEQESVNIVEFVSLSSAAYAFWTSILKEIVEVVDDFGTYRFISDSIYGGRVQVNIRLFNPQDGSFGVYLDVSSLYPAACVGTDRIKVKYPVGMGRWSKVPKEEFDNGKLGIYEIRFECPRDLRVPILPRNKLDGGIEWSLFDGQGVYNSVDISNAIRHNYHITFIGDCYVYDKTSSTLFTDYINKWYNIKRTTDNKCLGKCRKLLQNGLTGKLSQKPILQESKFIYDNDQLEEFINTHNKSDWTSLDDSLYYPVCATGEISNAGSKAIKKPNHLGSFVYAYARSIMLDYFEVIDPTLKTCVFGYTDTDSMFVTEQNYIKLKNAGLVLDKKEAKLGYLCNELEKDNCPNPVVRYAKFLGLKLYRMKYIDANGVEGEKLVAKAIPKELVKSEMYDNKTSKVSFKSNKKESNFDVIETKYTRTINDNYSGMMLIDNEYYPKNYIFN